MSGVVRQGEAARSARVRAPTPGGGAWGVGQAAGQRHATRADAFQAGAGRRTRQDGDGDAGVRLAGLRIGLGLRGPGAGRVRAHFGRSEGGGGEAGSRSVQ